MAFEIPLEADRVDHDSNLFSSLVRAPVIGTLSWIFGSNNNDNKQRRVDDDNDECDDCCSSNSSIGSSTNTTEVIDPPSISVTSSSSATSCGVEFVETSTTTMYCPSRQRYNKQRMVPNLMGSEISDASDMMLLESSSATTMTKELSWSDEKGNSLITICGRNESDDGYQYFDRKVS